MSKKHWTLLAVLGIVVIVGSSVRANLHESHRTRLNQIREQHRNEVVKINDTYRRSIERVNAVLTNQYQTVIDAYQNRGEEAVVAQLKEELASSLAPLPQAGHSELIENIGPTLVGADGKTVSSRMLGDADYVLLYFTAEWCGPCKAFTPTLVEFYNTHARAKNFEVVMVSSDRSERAMLGYMSGSKMPWKAIPYDRIDASGLKTKHNIRGIPSLVPVDRDGKVVAEGSAGVALAAFKKLIE